MSRSAAGPPPSRVDGRLRRGPKRRPFGTGADGRERHAAARASSRRAGSDTASAAGRSIGIRTGFLADIRADILGKRRAVLGAHAMRMPRIRETRSPPGGGAAAGHRSDGAGAIRPVHGLARTHQGRLDLRVGQEGRPCG